MHPGSPLPVRLRPYLALVVAIGSLASMIGCGSGSNDDFVRDAPNRPPFILDNTIRTRPPAIGTNLLDECIGAVVPTVRPAVEVTYPVIDLEDACGEAYFYWSDNGGLTYRPATESVFREILTPSPDCAQNLTTTFCAPCQPVIPVGPSSAGALVSEPDNHALPTCMTARGGGQTNRFYWDVFADGVGFPDSQQVVFCIVPTDPFNPLPADVLDDNNDSLDGTNPSGQIDGAIFRERLQNEPTTPGFFCTDSFTVSSPFTRVGIFDQDVAQSQLRVGQTGLNFDLPIRITNVNSVGPTCFFVGFQYDPSHLNFEYFDSAAFAMGVAPTSADLVHPTPLLSALGGQVQVVSPPLASMTGNEDFVVFQVTAPAPLIGGTLFELDFRAGPLPPSPPGGPVSAAISILELVPVGTAGCLAAPASCSTRADWQIPAVDYTGVVNTAGGAMGCNGTEYPFQVEPPVAITCIEDFPPECCIRAPQTSDFRGDGLAINYFLEDFEAEPITITPEFSTDGGLTWQLMTELAADALSEGTVGLASGTGLPCPMVPTAADRPCDIAGCSGDLLGAVEHFFVWDIDADIPPSAGFICEIDIRITPDDGRNVGVGCTQSMPNFLEGPNLIFRRASDPSLPLDTVISTQAGGHPVILPQLPDSEEIRVFARSFNGAEIDVTASVVFTSSDPQTIDVVFNPMTGGADVVNDPLGLVPGSRARCDIGNQCVVISATFTGFTMPPFSTCPIGILDPVTGLPLASLIGSFAACTDLGGPDYDGQRAAYMQLGDFDAEIPGLPSGPPIPGMGGTFDITFWVDVETRDIGAYSVNLEWMSAAMAFEDIFASPVVLNLTPNTTMAMAAPVARLEWNAFTIAAGLRGVLELETVRFRTVCASGACSTPFTFTIDTLVDQGAMPIGGFIGGAADSATDCHADFTVP